MFNHFIWGSCWWNLNLPLSPRVVTLLQMKVLFFGMQVKPNGKNN